MWNDCTDSGSQGGIDQLICGVPMPIKNSALIEINGQSVPITLTDPESVESVELTPSPRILYAPIGQCIYCGGGDGLSDEHIIPYGLSGSEVLPKSSCAACARETGRFEQLVLRGPMRAARIHRRLKSRTKHNGGPETHRATLIKDSGEEAIDLPITEYPILLHFPIFAQPGHLTGATSPGIVMTGMNTILFGPKPDDVARKYDARAIRFPSMTLQPIAFARMVAKIAYGYAAGNGQLTLIDGQSFVLPCILGHSEDVGMWVFTEASKTINYPGVLHCVTLHLIEEMLIGKVHLFADSQTPAYGVILGKLKVDSV